MKIRHLFLTSLILLAVSSGLMGQYTPWMHWTLLPDEIMDEIIGETSGETAWKTIMETGGYNKDRLADEYETTFYESSYIYEQLKKYGLPGADIVRFPGGKVWDGIEGELWEVKPNRQKLASYLDNSAMLVSGSRNADVTAELVWVGQGRKKDLDGLDVKGKIVVTEGGVSQAYAAACTAEGALGVIAISQSRPAFDPLQIPWRGIRNRGGRDTVSGFAFYLPFREGLFLKQRLLRREKITVEAQVKAEERPYTLQCPVCFIPGTDPKAEEIIFSAHLFEGYVKQGANDNKSGSAAILEIARTLHRLIESGRIPRPRRTIRFLWGPEYSGTGPWVKANRELMEKTFCNINLDMVGEWLSLNQAHFCLMRTTYGNSHYINDVMENYYRFVGEGNRERIQGRSTASPYRFPRRIVAPFGADEPFIYSIETHYGASDHEVFNDWGVQVPGVMMIAWPDQWYHTSGDRVNKSDPTQLKRVAVIGAAAAYTVATADEDDAVRLASEIVSNGTRRLGHQLMRGIQALNEADADGFGKAYRQAWVYLVTAVRNEKNTLDSLHELAPTGTSLISHVKFMKQAVDEMGRTHLKTIEAHMRSVADGLGVEPADIIWTDKELGAEKIIPVPTSRVREKGYRGYREYLDEVPKDVQKKYTYRRGNIASTGELQCLINGKNSALDIKLMLDSQYEKESKLEDIQKYLDLLKAAGLITYK